MSDFLTLWNTFKKQITDPLQKLSMIHNNTSLAHGTFRDEFTEQIMAATFVKPYSKVLEIGGNIGRNSLVLSRLLDNPKNLVVLESDPDNGEKLKYNFKINNIDSNLEISALSKSRLIQKDWDTTPLVTETIPDGWKEVDTITYDNLLQKYNIVFDTIVADCEGALMYIFRDFPTILNGINTIVMENDYKIIDHCTEVHKKLIDEGFKCVYTERGGWGGSDPLEKIFYQTWQRS